jgi:hypothetical protein
MSLMARLAAAESRRTTKARKPLAAESSLVKVAKEAGRKRSLQAETGLSSANPLLDLASERYGRIERQDGAEYVAGQGFRPKTDARHSPRQVAQALAGEPAWNTTGPEGLRTIEDALAARARRAGRLSGDDVLDVIKTARAKGGLEALKAEALGSQTLYGAIDPSGGLGRAVTRAQRERASRGELGQGRRLIDSLTDVPRADRELMRSALYMSQKATSATPGSVAGLEVTRHESGYELDLPEGTAAGLIEAYRADPSRFRAEWTRARDAFRGKTEPDPGPPPLSARGPYVDFWQDLASNAERTTREFEGAKSEFAKATGRLDRFTEHVAEKAGGGLPGLAAAFGTEAALSTPRMLLGAVNAIDTRLSPEARAWSFADALANAYGSSLLARALKVPPKALTLSGAVEAVEARKLAVPPRPVEAIAKALGTDLQDPVVAKAVADAERLIDPEALTKAVGARARVVTEGVWQDRTRSLIQEIEARMQAHPRAAKTKGRGKELRQMDYLRDRLLKSLERGEPDEFIVDELLDARRPRDTETTAPTGPRPAEPTEPAAPEAARPRPMEPTEPAAPEAARPRPMEPTEPAVPEAARPRPVEPTEPRAQGKGEIEYEDVPGAGRVRMVPIEQLRVNPEIQYKDVVDRTHMVGAHAKDVETFDVDQAGVLVGWQRLDGGIDVVHGHHRRYMGLNAKRWVRATPSGDAVVRERKVPVTVLREADGWTLPLVRVRGVLENLRAGNGSAFEAVMGLKEVGAGPDSLKAMGVSLKGKLARNVSALMNLEPEALEKVRRRVVDEDTAAGIASVKLPDGQAQAGAIDAADKAGIKGFVDGQLFGQRYAGALVDGGDWRQGALGSGGEWGRAMADSLGEQVKLQKAVTKALLARYKSLQDGLRLEPLEGETIQAEARRALMAELGETKGSVAWALDRAFANFEDIGEKLRAYGNAVASRTMTFRQAVEELQQHVAQSIKGATARELVEGRRSRPEAGRTGAAQELADPVPEGVVGGTTRGGERPGRRFDVTDEDTFVSALVEAVGRTVGQDQIEGVRALARARAVAWAERTGRAPREYFAARIAGLAVDDPQAVGAAQSAGTVAKGATQWLQDGRAVIHLFTDSESAASDVSTIVHELAHVWMRELDDDTLRIVQDAFEEAASAPRRPKSVEEFFARGFERYLADGEAAKPGLAGVFEQFKRWMAAVYRNILESSIGTAVSPRLRTVFDDMLGDPARFGDDAAQEGFAFQGLFDEAPGVDGPPRGESEVDMAGYARVAKAAMSADGLGLSPQGAVTHLETWGLTEEQAREAVRMAGGRLWGKEERPRQGGLFGEGELDGQQAFEFQVRDNVASGVLYSGDEQLSFEWPLEPGARPEAVRAAVQGIDELRRTGSVLALAFTRRLIKAGQAAFAGLPAGSPAEVAQLLRIVRDPRFETGRWIAVRDGRIVGHRAMTARVPFFVHLTASDASGNVVDEITEWMRALKADTFYAAHNHPSGSPKASPQDIEATEKVFAKVPGFNGHWIVGRDETSRIDANSRIESYAFKRPGRMWRPDPDHPVLGRQVLNSDDLKAVAEVLDPPTDALIGLDNTGHVRTVHLMAPSETKRTVLDAEALRAFGEDAGAIQRMVVVHHAESERAVIQAFKKGLIADAVMTDMEMTIGQVAARNAQDPVVQAWLGARTKVVKDEQWLFQEEEPGPVWRSKLTETIRLKMANAVPVGELRRMLEAAGVKQDEIQWTGFDEFLKANNGRKVSKAEAEAFLRENEFRLEERVLSEDGPDKPWYREHTVPGGTRYREWLLKVPGQARFRTSHWQADNLVAHARTTDRETMNGKRLLFVEEVQSDWHQRGARRGYLADDEMKRASEIVVERQPGGGAVLYTKATLGFPQYYGHVLRDDKGRFRMSFSRGSFGEFVEAREQTLDGAIKELADTMRRYLDTWDLPRPAQGPFATSWPEMTMRRMAREATEGGYDGLGWVGGDIPGQRYGQATGMTADYLMVRKRVGPDEFEVLAMRDGTKIVDDVATSDRLRSLIGPKLADEAVAAMEAAPDWSKAGRIEIGGHGMRSFYDERLVRWAKKFGKAFGAEPKAGTIETPYGEQRIWAMPITDAMRRSVNKGQWLFQHAEAPTQELAKPVAVRPEELSPRRRQTETAEFKRWFGESKVVDENGEPLVVYQGAEGGPTSGVQSKVPGAPGTPSMASATKAADWVAKLMNQIEKAAAGLGSPLDVMRHQGAAGTPRREAGRRLASEVSQVLAYSAAHANRIGQEFLREYRTARAEAMGGPMGRWNPKKAKEAREALNEVARRRLFPSPEDEPLTGGLKRLDDLLTKVYTALEKESASLQIWVDRFVGRDMRYIPVGTVVRWYGQSPATGQFSELMGKVVSHDQPFRLGVQVIGGNQPRGGLVWLDPFQKFTTSSLVKGEDYIPKVLKREYNDAFELRRGAEWEELVEAARKSLEESARAGDAPGIGAGPVSREMAVRWLDEMFAPGVPEPHPDAATGKFSRIERFRVPFTLPEKFYELDVHDIVMKDVQEKALRIASARMWGYDHRRLANLIAEATGGGAESANVASLVSYALGQDPAQHSKTMRAWTKAAAVEGTWQAVSKLTGLGTAVIQLSAAANIGAVAGIKTAAQGLYKTIADLAKHRKEFARLGAEYVMFGGPVSDLPHTSELGKIARSDVIGQGAMAMFAHHSDRGLAKQVADTALTVTGVKPIDVGLRYWAAVTGRLAVEEAVKRLRLTQDGKVARTADYRLLADWFLFSDADIERMATTNRLEPGDVLMAYDGGGKTQLRSRNADIPKAVRNSPALQIATRLQTFNYNQAKLMGWLTKEALKGNPKPLVRTVAGYAALGFVTVELRDQLIAALEDREPKPKIENLAGRVAHNFFRSGALGVFGLPFEGGRWKEPLDEAAGSMDEWERSPAGGMARGLQQYWQRAMPPVARDMKSLGEAMEFATKTDSGPGGALYRFARESVVPFRRAAKRAEPDLATIRRERAALKKELETQGYPQSMADWVVDGVWPYPPPLGASPEYTDYWRNKDALVGAGAKPSEASDLLGGPPRRFAGEDPRPVRPRRPRFDRDGLERLAAATLAQRRESAKDQSRRVYKELRQ